MSLTLGISIVALLATLVGVLVAVLIAIRKDSKQTGKVEQQVINLTTSLAKLDADRATMIATTDARVSEALRMHNELTAQRDREIIETVKKFQQTVDDLKVAVSNIQNMWAGERKLVETIRRLELELVRLQTEHDRCNVCQRESGPIAKIRKDRQEAAPLTPMELFEAESDRTGGK
jgi:uncharacterized protein with PIN domain